MEIDGLKDFAESVLGNEDADKLRIRAGKNGRTTRTVNGLDAIDLNDYETDQSGLERAIRRGLEKALRGGKRPSWRVEALNAKGKALPGALTGREETRRVEPTPVPKANDLVDLDPVQMLYGMISPLVQSLTDSMKIMQDVVSTQGDTIADLGRQNWDKAQEAARLHGELERAKANGQIDLLRAQLGAGEDGMSEQEREGMALLEKFGERFLFGGAGGTGGLTKAELLKMIDRNPKQAVALMADKEVLAKIGELTRNVKD